MSKYLVTFLAPAAVIDEWQKTEPGKRKAAEDKMMADWKQWMASHAKSFVDFGAGVGKTKRVTPQGSANTRNDIMVYSVVEAESHDAAAKMFEGHPHLGIPQSSIEVMEIRAMPPM